MLLFRIKQKRNSEVIDQQKEYFTTDQLKLKVNPKNE